MRASNIDSAVSERLYLERDDLHRNYDANRYLPIGLYLERDDLYGNDDADNELQLRLWIFIGRRVYLFLVA